MTETFRLKRVALEDGGEVFLWLHAAEPPTDESWNDAMAAMRAYDGEHNGDIGKLRFLVVTDGGAPTTAMRGLFTDWLNSRTLPVAVITESTIARGVVTAISWFNPKIKAFSPQRWRDALGHVRIETSKKEEMMVAFTALEATLGQRNRCLAAMRAEIETTRVSG